jgi:hypothetical protein
MDTHRVMICGTPRLELRLCSDWIPRHMQNDLVTHAGNEHVLGDKSCGD